MVKWDLSQHPELRVLIDELHVGGVVMICDHGEPVAEVTAASAIDDDTFAFVHKMESPVYPGNSVVDARAKERY